MALDFPAAPRFGDKYSIPDSPHYTWNSFGWQIGEVRPPPPLLVLMTPNSAVVGDPSPVLVTLQGNYFQPASVVRIDGLPMASTFVSANQMTFNYSIPTAAKVAQVNVVNPDAQSSATLPFTTTLTPYELLSLSPNAVVVGGTSPALITASGNNFTATSVVTVDNAAVPTSFVSATTVTFQYPIPATPTVVQVRVVTDGQISAALPLETVLAPLATSMTPTSANSATSGGEVVRITGANFVSGLTQACIDGVPQTTQVETPTLCNFTTMAPTPVPKTLMITVKNGAIPSPSPAMPFYWS